MAAPKTSKSESKGPGWLKALGPGVVTGASDDDPSGIGTYSQAGAQFGYGMLWTMILSFPLMAVIQEISGRIGRVTGRGLAGNLRLHFPRWLLYGAVSLLLVANIFNIAADLGAMGAAMQLLVGGPHLPQIVLFAVFSLGLQVFVPYSRYVSFLKWLTLTLLAYFITAFTVHIPWKEVTRHTLLPGLSWDPEALKMVVAIFGTTLSPYLFFWQASEEVEEMEAAPRSRPLKSSPGDAPAELRRIRLDTVVGMALSNSVAFFIILTAGATLNHNGVLHVETAAQAALALKPLAGRFAFLLFACGIISTGLLAIPVLAGSAAYAVAEAMHWPVGLERLPQQAKGFYGVIVVATLLGLAINFFHFNAMQALFWSAILNGVIATPIMFLMMLVSRSRKIMGKFTLPPILVYIGWIATAVMAAITLGLFATL